MWQLQRERNTVAEGIWPDFYERLFLDMYQAGVTFTYLMPAAEAIYLPHDFRTMYEQNIEYYAPEEKLAESITVQAAEHKDCDEISAWAQKELARKYQVYAKRDKNYYERLLKELACEDGKLIIYRKRWTDC